MSNNFKFLRDEKLTTEELDILMDCLDVCSEHYDESYDDTDKEKINFNTLYDKMEQLQKKN